MLRVYLWIIVHVIQRFRTLTSHDGMPRQARHEIVSSFTILRKRKSSIRPLPAPKLWRKLRNKPCTNQNITNVQDMRFTSDLALSRSRQHAAVGWSEVNFSCQYHWIKFFLLTTGPIQPPGFLHGLFMRSQSPEFSRALCSTRSPEQPLPYRTNFSLSLFGSGPIQPCLWVQDCRAYFDVSRSLEVHVSGVA